MITALKLLCVVVIFAVRVKLVMDLIDVINMACELIFDRFFKK